MNIGNGDDSDDLRGGPGDLVESDEVNPRDRARLMAIFARLLASSDVFSDDEADVSQLDTFRILRAMAENDSEESTAGEENDEQEQEMDTSE